MQRDRLNIGTTLRVASLALAIGLLASPAAAQTYGDWNAMNGSGGGAGGKVRLRRGRPRGHAV